MTTDVHRDIQPPESRFVTVDGVRMHYHKVSGPVDATPVIFTHGGGPGCTSWNNFRLSAAAFATHHPCYFVDLPQYGGSDMACVEGPFFSWHAAKLLGFMDALGIGQAHLVNQSLGGCVAIPLAARHPERVARLVMIGSQPVSRGVLSPLMLTSKHGRGIISDYYLEEGGPSLPRMRRLIERLEFLRDDRVDDDNVRLRFAASDNPGFIALLKTAGAFGEREDLEPMLARVQSPTLICWGLHDWFGGIDVPMYLLNRMRDARLHVFGKGAHHLQSECPGEFNAVARAFLQEGTQ